MPHVLEGYTRATAYALDNKPLAEELKARLEARVRLAEASVEVDAARELQRRCIREILAKAERGEEFTNLERARYRRDKNFAARLCVQAVNRLFEASGGHAIAESEAMQRYHRDVHAASHHQGLSWDTAAEDFGRQALGLSPLPGRFG